MTLQGSANYRNPGKTARTGRRSPLKRGTLSSIPPPGVEPDESPPCSVQESPAAEYGQGKEDAEEEEVQGVHLLGEEPVSQFDEEVLDEQGTRQELRELYMLLETGLISEEEFEEREAELVERLEEIEAYKNGNGLSKTQ